MKTSDSQVWENFAAVAHNCLMKSVEAVLKVAEVLGSM
jgi:hypothetical protein